LEDTALASKEQLLKIVDQAIRTEEKVVAIYYDNYKVALSWIFFDEPTRQRTRESLERLARDSRRHKGMLEELRVRIMKESRDVF
jgi:rubrerythrin